MHVFFQCDTACLMGCHVLEYLFPFAVRQTGYLATSGSSCEYLFGRKDLLPKRVLKHNYEKDCMKGHIKKDRILETNLLPFPNNWSGYFFLKTRNALHLIRNGTGTQVHNIHISLLLVLDWCYPQQDPAQCVRQCRYGGRYSRLHHLLFYSYSDHWQCAMIKSSHTPH